MQRRNDERRERLDEHPTENGNRHRPRDVGSPPGRHQHGNQRSQGRERRHHAGADALQARLVDRRPQLVDRRHPPACQDLLNVAGDDDPVVRGDAEQGDEANPHRRVQFDARQRHGDHSSRKRYGDPAEHDQRQRHVAEVQVV